MIIFLRRRKLGSGSTKGIQSYLLEMGVNSLIVRNDRIPNRDFNNDIIVRWGCTSQFQGRNFLNSVDSIHTVNNKTSFRSILSEAGLSPLTFTNQAAALEFLRANPNKSLIVRPNVHAQGRHLWMVRTPEELNRAIQLAGNNWYASEFINKVSEYRVFVGSGRAVWVARKIPANPNDIAWNVARGGTFENVRWDDWPLKAVKTSIQAFLHSDLNFGGVDVMIDGAGKCYVLEINSAPSQTSPYRQECVAKYLKYVMENGKDTIPLQAANGGYKKFIHPALLLGRTT